MGNLKINHAKAWAGILCLFITVLFMNCNTTPDVVEVETIPEKPLIQPPIQELISEFEEKEFTIEKGLTWNFKNGTRIKIPANALVDENGNSLKGKATLKFRDYHDAVDVFLSGIPMGYNDGKGEKGNMETAGMFEMRAEVNGKNVALKNDVTVDVRLASHVGDKGYNSYYLNEEARQWEYLAENKAQKNTRKVNLKKQVEELRPEMVFPLDRKYFALDYRVLLDEYFSHKRKQFNDDLMQQKLKEYGLAWLDADSRDGVEYNGKKMPAALMVWKKISKEKIPSWVKNSKCTFLPKGNNQYIMRIEPQGKSYTTDVVVEMVMPVNYLFKLPPEEWANNYQVAFAKFKKEENRMALLSDFTRSLEANSFGIYNYDRIMKEDEAVLLAANFDFKEKFDETISQPDVYYIPGSERALVKYPQYQWKEFPLMPDEKGLLFSLLPGNKLAIYSNKKYAKIDFQKLRNHTTPSHHFDMVTIVENITSVKDIKNALLN